MECQFVQTTRQACLCFDLRFVSAHSSRFNMSPRGPLSTVITTVVGATLGGLFLWRVYHTHKRKLLSGEKAADPVEPLHPADKEFSTVEGQLVQASHLNKEVKAAKSQTTQLPLPVRIPSAEQLLAVKPVTVSSEEEWQQLWPSLQKELSVYPVLGLDCEWVSLKGSASAVSLLQIASYSGLCVLVRMLPFRSSAQLFPHSLMQVLCDPHILKVGVGCHEDGKRLAHDYGLLLGCTVDLRYLALRHGKVILSNGLSLKSLAADVLKITLDKSLELRCSDWEADELTLEQMNYAARDAQVSIALFFHLLGLHSESSFVSSSESTYFQLAAHCQGLVDIPFRSQGGERDDKAADGERRRRRAKKQPQYESPKSGDQQVPDSRKNHKRKPLGVGYSPRKSPLYDNCFLHAPDGQPLCSCDKKKAKWYLDKGIGELQSEDPFIVRLLFEPSGRPESRQEYYLTAKENLCVVCGKEYSYNRKHIVPQEYRRHFPTEMKDHNSHDILLLCTACHAASNVHDCLLKQQLAQEYSAPQASEEGLRLFQDTDRRRVRSAARALVTAGNELPEQRHKELQTIIRDFLNLEEDQELDAEALQQVADLETRIFNEEYMPHGRKVVSMCAKDGIRGLMDLERRWRQHFLTTMQPRHLPALWSIDHNHSKFLRKYGEDLPVHLI
ncbi:exonuclease 3'-5' domain-containing protein 2 isoform X2 [Lampris incognitus]|uniref:exonuclease 3'-5' domain-containing protein 2 isoform X2 n=1 Tax=Lampris incognitus TaxID=2546036 RepID=UPI0024B4DB3B|nr:exonuclease 3'-5' domain-containing protein 2 isoform X2 [Lampris incognitus]